MMRRLIFAGADDPRVRRFVHKHGMRLGAARFVAGETLDQCVAVLRRLNEQGLAANTTLLGEGVRDESEAAGVVAAMGDGVARLAAGNLLANVALRRTQSSI